MKRKNGKIFIELKFIEGIFFRSETNQVGITFTNQLNLFHFENCPLKMCHSKQKKILIFLFHFYSYIQRKSCVHLFGIQWFKCFRPTFKPKTVHTKYWTGTHRTNRKMVWKWFSLFCAQRELFSSMYFRLWKFTLTTFNWYEPLWTYDHIKKMR